MKSESDVPSILKADGVSAAFLDGANRDITHIPDIIAHYGTDRSWAHTLVNSASNSATLICQLPGEGNRRHHHPDWNEWWLIVDGTWEWEIDGDRREVRKGDVVFIIRNRKHKITAIGDRAAIRLAVSRYDVAHVYEEADY